MTQLLLRHVAVDVKDQLGRTALHLATLGLPVAWQGLSSVFGSPLWVHVCFFMDFQWIFIGFD